jgi:hypothetical protein
MKIIFLIFLQIVFIAGQPTTTFEATVKAKRNPFIIETNLEDPVPVQAPRQSNERPQRRQCN